MTSRLTYSQKCCYCAKTFPTIAAVRKHLEIKHQKVADSNVEISFWDNAERLVTVPCITSMDRRSRQYKEEYLPSLAGLTEQINASLHPSLRGKYF